MPEKTYLSRAQSRAWSLDHPVGDAFGGPAYGERRDPGSALIASAGIQVGGSLLGGMLADDNGAEDANNQAAASSRQQMVITGDMWDFYKTHYRPLEEQVVREAGVVGGDVDQEQAAARAAASVSAGFDSANEATKASMLAMGVRQDSPAFAAAVGQGEAMRGANTARAGNDAREDTKWRGREWRRSVVEGGKGIPGQAINSYGANTAQQTQRAQWGTNMQRQQAGDIGYALQPAAKAASDWFKASKWGGTKTTGGFGTGAGANMGAYDDMASMAGGGSGGELWLAEGGQVDGFGVRRPDGSMDMAGPGVLQGPGTGTSDSIPAETDTGQKVQLSTGEYVIPADVVRAKGTEFFDKVVKSVTEPKRSAQ
jgi:hypothetical protein